ncbi:MAG: hypothetical protein WBA12_13545, partial [Catalinimonas sp.]
GSVSTGDPYCELAVVNCVLREGDIRVQNNGYNLTAAGDSLLHGQIYFTYGKVSGCYVDVADGAESCVEIWDDNRVSNDTLYVIGNRLYGTTIGTSAIGFNVFRSGIRASSADYFYAFHNNYIEVRGGWAGDNRYKTMGIYTTVIKNSNVGVHTITNNTVVNTVGTQMYPQGAYYIDGGSSNTRVDMYNNLGVDQAASANNGMYVDGGTIGSPVVGFNVFNSGSMSGVADNGTNRFNSNTTMNGLAPAPGSDAVDAGNPNEIYTDLDLTRNDAGAYGGSFSLENFLPGGGFGPRVFFVKAPRRVLIGNTVDVEAAGYAK